ncbi:MAG: hypothetical protein K0S16_1337, partial [Moraxellaceae bacterium]|nr:hypothetical protein [Moraxellaceae bacterium]
MKNAASWAAFSSARPVVAGVLEAWREMQRGYADHALTLTGSALA